MNPFQERPYDCTEFRKFLRGHLAAKSLCEVQCSGSLGAQSRLTLHKSFRSNRSEFVRKFHAVTQVDLLTTLIPE
jgi:hypothetical protein